MLLCVSSVSSVVYSSFQFQSVLLSYVLSFLALYIGSCITHGLSHIFRFFKNASFMLLTLCGRPHSQSGFIAYDHDEVI